MRRISLLTNGFCPAVLLLPILLLMSERSARAIMVTVQPSADTSLFEAFADANSGANPNMVAGANTSLDRGRAVFRFALAGVIPSNAIIESVSLTITVVIVPPNRGEASTFDLHRLLVDWGEGVGTNNTGTASQPGEANWNARFYPSNLWTIPGGLISNDFSEVISASLFLPDLGTYTFVSTSNLVSDVQAWVQNPAANFGWILMSESEDVPLTVRRIGTRESLTKAPLLNIHFTLPIVPSVQISKSNAGIELSFLASAGHSYSVDYRETLNFGNWLMLTNLGPQSTTTNVFVMDPFPTNAHRFYRVVQF